MKNPLQPAPPDITNLINTIRGQRVILDSDLARLYGVPTKRLNEQYRRNRRRFPEDFAFRLTPEEAAALRSQNAALETGRGKHAKVPPSSVGDEIAEALRALGDGLAGTLDSSRRIPQYIEFEIRRRAMIRALEIGAPLPHDNLGDGQRFSRLFPICVRGRVLPPDVWSDLVARNLADQSERAIVVARLDLRQRLPPLHGLHVQTSAHGPHRSGNQKFRFQTGRQTSHSIRTSIAEAMPLGQKLLNQGADAKSFSRPATLDR